MQQFESEIDQLFHAHHPQLVRLCAYLTGDADAAEDLAQETLIEAWRHTAALRDPTALPAWLNGIARNVCLRWHRKHGREVARAAHASAINTAPAADFVAEVERSELADLLDRALTLLPPETRAVLVQKYVEESPHAEIAARLGLSTGAVAMRLQRGRLALQRVLATELQADAAAYGLVQATTKHQHLNHWCPHCGKHRLALHHHADTRLLELCCPDCDSAAGVYLLTTHYRRQAPIKSYWPLLTSFMRETSERVRQPLLPGTPRCDRCDGSTTALLLVVGETMPLYAPLVTTYALPADTRLVVSTCAGCGSSGWAYASEFALYAAAGMRFWRNERRIRTLPQQIVTAQGRAALLTRMESLTTTARLDVLLDAATLEVIVT